MKLLIGEKFKTKILATMFEANTYPFIRFLGIAIGQSFIGICWRVKK